MDAKEQGQEGGWMSYIYGIHQLFGGESDVCYEDGTQS